MNQKVLILAVGVLAGAAAVYFIIPRGGQATTAPEQHETAAAVEAVAPTPAPAPKPAVTTASPRPAKPSAPAPAPVSAWARLAEKYGAEKTTLSSKITSNLTGVIKEALKIGEAFATNSGAASIAEATGRALVRGASRELALTPEQEEKAVAIMQAAVAKRISAIGDLTAALDSEPEQMMELFLAGDAFARKEISEAEYDRLTLPTRTMLKQLGGFIAGTPGSGGAAQAMADAETLAELNALLSPEQQVKLAEMAARLAQQAQARQAAMNNSPLAWQPGQVPILELDKLDQSVAAVRQMTDAARMMMEAMRGLKEANAGAPPPR
jgi:hypothetical protein